MLVLLRDVTDASLLQTVFNTSTAGKTKGKRDYRDTGVYMGYVQEGAEAERGYSMREGTDTFASQAASAAFEMTANDENSSHSAVQKASMLRWDRRHKKFVKGDGTGSDNKKLIRTESGAKLPASFKSGTFDEWKRKQKVYMPKTGEAELKDRQVPGGPGGKRYRHTGTATQRVNAKPSRMGKGGIISDKGKSKSKGAEEAADGKKTRSNLNKNLMGGKRASAQLKSVDQIRKDRAQKANRVRRSTQPGKRKK